MAQNQGPYLFQALDQCIQLAPHIVDTGIWDVSMAGRGAQTQCAHWGLGISCWMQTAHPKGLGQTLLKGSQPILAFRC